MPAAPEERANSGANQQECDDRRARQYASTSGQECKSGPKLRAGRAPSGRTPEHVDLRVVSAAREV